MKSINTTMWQVRSLRCASCRALPCLRDSGPGQVRTDACRHRSAPCPVVRQQPRSIRLRM